jgi:hypothetical protein
MDQPTSVGHQLGVTCYGSRWAELPVEKREAGGGCAPACLCYPPHGVCVNVIRAAFRAVVQSTRSESEPARLVDDASEVTRPRYGSAIAHFVLQDRIYYGVIQQNDAGKHATCANGLDTGILYVLVGEGQIALLGSCTVGSRITARVDHEVKYESAAHRYDAPVGWRSARAANSGLQEHEAVSRPWAGVSARIGCGGSHPASHSRLNSTVSGCRSGGSERIGPSGRKSAHSR